MPCYPGCRASFLGRARPCASHWRALKADLEGSSKLQAACKHLRNYQDRQAWPRDRRASTGQKERLGFARQHVLHGLRAAVAVEGANLHELGERHAILCKQGKKCGVHRGTNMDGKLVFVAQATKT